MALFGKTKEKVLAFERRYEAPVGVVWEAWTRPEALAAWWGPEHTTVPECEIDLRVGGRIYVVTEAGPGMGKYEGTRWPMEGTFSTVETNARLGWDARSWTEGDEATTTIVHANDLSLEEVDGMTTVRLDISITDIGSGAKLAAFGMKYGYRQYLDKLGVHLSGRPA